MIIEIQQAQCLHDCYIKKKQRLTESMVPPGGQFVKEQLSAVIGKRQKAGRFNMSMAIIDLTG